MRVGQGFDVHRLVADRRLLLGGVEIPFEKGLEGHSDGDSLLHAVADAILGAIGAGDLGRHFPSSDERWRGADSREILREVASMMRKAGYHLENLDATIIAEAPRLSPYQNEIEKNLVEILGSSEDRINLKLTSTDRLGAIGRGEGIAGMAIVLLAPNQMNEGEPDARA